MMVSPCARTPAGDVRISETPLAKAALGHDDISRMRNMLR